MTALIQKGDFERRPNRLERTKQVKPRIGTKQLTQNLRMLRDMDALLEGRQPLPRSSGIYFLFRLDQVVYVGQSLDITARLIQHRQLGLIQFDSFVAIKFPPEHLDYYEHMAISHHNPIHNRNAPSIPRRKKREPTV